MNISSKYFKNYLKRNNIKSANDLERYLVFAQFATDSIKSQSYDIIKFDKSFTMLNSTFSKGTVYTIYELSDAYLMESDTMPLKIPFEDWSETLENLYKKIGYYIESAEK